MIGSTAPLGDLAIAHYGEALKEAERQNGPYLVYGSSGEVGHHDRRIVDFPTLIVGRKGSVGTITYAPDGGWPIDTAFYLELKEPERVDLRYLYWRLSRARLGTRAITTSIPGLNRDELYRTKIPLLPLAEQRRIAAMLDKADGVRRKRRESLALLDEFLRSAFLEMFGDPVRNETGWERLRASDVLARIEAGSSVNGEEGSPGPGELAVLKISAVTSGWYLPNQCKVVAQAPKAMVVPARGDLLFSRANTRELVAATCLVDQDAPQVFLPDKLWRIAPNPKVAAVEYLRYLLADPHFRRTLTKDATGTSGSMLNVSQEKLLRLQLPIPPLDLQQEFGAMVWKTYETRHHLQEAGGETNRLFASLAGRVFGGHA